MAHVPDDAAGNVRLRQLAGVLAREPYSMDASGPTPVKHLFEVAGKLLSLRFSSQSMTSAPLARALLKQLEAEGGGKVTAGIKTCLDVQELGTQLALQQGLLAAAGQAGVPPAIEPPAGGAGSKATKRKAADEEPARSAARQRITDRGMAMILEVFKPYLGDDTYFSDIPASTGLMRAVVA